MHKENKNGMSRSARLFIKSAFWTVTAITLALIGYFGAELLWGFR